LSSNQKINGFGFDPSESEHHFAVYTGGESKDVVIFELTEFEEKPNYSALGYKITSAASPARCILHKAKWELIKGELRVEFNKRLKAINLPTYQWKSGFNSLHRTFGKELLVLAWAIEDADPGTIPLAIQNWLGLKPEERWWLFTITNAATGHALNGKGKGWRVALRYALTENPVISERITLKFEKSDDTPNLFADEDEVKKFGSKNLNKK
jgi:hypothetical protein